MDLREFLQAVVTVNTPGYFLLALGPRNSPGWYENWFKWPDDLEKILDVALTEAAESNVYFSTYIFKSPSTTKENVLPTRTIQADLDDADILTLPLQPSVLVQTSQGRHQGYWFLKEALDPEAHEVLSRKLTYSIPQCDTSGWPLGRKVRVPFTFNYKYLEGAQQIQIAASSLKVYEEGDLEFLVEPPGFLATKEDVEFLDAVADAGSSFGLGNTIGPRELLNSLGDRIKPANIRVEYNTRQEDRSRALWSLLLAGFRAGLDREQVWYLAWHSANNKFADLKYHAERELAKDVLRAEAKVKSKVPDERATIADARKLPGVAHERRQHMLELIIGFMRASGEFIHTADDMTWYIRSDLGRPIIISPRSEWLDMMLDMQFGLNGVEQDKSYVSVGLTNFCRSLPVNGIQQALSYYAADSKALLLHTGRKDVIRVTAKEITKASDGSYGVLFPWAISNEAFNPVLTSGGSGASAGGPRADWGDVLFRSALDNVIGLDADAAQALLQVWLIFLLFRSMAISRPILAFFGQPGAGKSTLFRRIYTLLFGKQRSLSGVTNPDNFDHAVATECFLVLDNVDRPEAWLPDRLALSASTSDITKRKLYTDADDFILKRQALLGITAHNPHFNREDVADRLLLLTFSRLTKFLPEGDIIASIHEQRHRLWGGIILDCQRVLQTPMPAYADAPQFRVEDFARTGYWIATALGVQEQFTMALKTVGKGQKTLNLEEDHILVVALQVLLRFREAKKKASEFQGAQALWNDLALLPIDVAAFQRVYRNAVFLGKKLWALQDSLKEIFDIEWQYNPAKGAREWRISGVLPTAPVLIQPSTNGTTSSAYEVTNGTTVTSNPSVH